MKFKTFVRYAFGVKCDLSTREKRGETLTQLIEYFDKKAPCFRGCSNFYECSTSHTLWGEREYYSFEDSPLADYLLIRHNATKLGNCDVAVPDRVPNKSFPIYHGDIVTWQNDRFVRIAEVDGFRPSDSKPNVFCKAPSLFEGVKWTGDNLDEVLALADEKFPCSHIITNNYEISPSKYNYNSYFFRKVENSRYDLLGFYCRRRGELVMVWNVGDAVVCSAGNIGYHKYHTYQQLSEKELKGLVDHVNAESVTSQDGTVGSNPVADNNIGLGD